MLPIDPSVAAIIEELSERLKILEEENAKLRKKVEEQAEKIEEQARIIEEWKRGHRTRPRPNTRKKKAGEKKKPGRKKGHDGAQRPIPDRIDSEIKREKDKCSDCTGTLTPTGSFLICGIAFRVLFFL